MREKLVPLAPYLLALGVNFYLLPLLVRDTGAAMVLMLCVMPLAAFLTGTACGLRRGFRPLLALAAAVLFLPTVWIHYNTSAWIYTVFYAAAVLAGNGVGRLFFRKR